MLAHICFLFFIWKKKIQHCKELGKLIPNDLVRVKKDCILTEDYEATPSWDGPGICVCSFRL